MSKPTLKLGSRGADVRELHHRLVAAGLDMRPDTPWHDDEFAKWTDGWVRELQHYKGLVVDGIVGPKTWGALGVQTDHVVNTQVGGLGDRFASELARARARKLHNVRVYVCTLRKVASFPTMGVYEGRPEDMIEMQPQWHVFDDGRARVCVEFHGLHLRDVLSAETVERLADGGRHNVYFDGRCGTEVEYV